MVYHSEAGKLSRAAGTRKNSVSHSATFAWYSGERMYPQTRPSPSDGLQLGSALLNRL